MAANPLIFKDAEKARDAILGSQKKEISNLYKTLADELGEKQNIIRTNPPQVIQEQTDK